MGLTHAPIHRCHQCVAPPLRPAPSRSRLLPLFFLAVFGLISDRYGRKWPLVANLIIVAVLSLGTGFVHNFSEFLAVRSL